ncbi:MULTISPECIES: DUF4156 domain-containing protein [Aliivibrio]|uniref:DUF4156 domain-containing protein n=1 Tax=Aliivibrio finisterrensis TaxID=511998 RepID=A0A4Q5KW12_9GAMM|nr:MULTISPECIES: DUF4156 domain-containing protein [Aliivibrio]MDD9177665.1 DUF4156 domain-containing protein [Aliivibrio sp. A6]RYU51275.1 DUF4156 domain-containing protein [Aliivibrio finisterrensis]RYU54472.1 DUF4156 domain-containing protein [Aliivibrio finisterrensis]RYU59540.1 DUF4156 domain-containing protein [Aliivibrio finisterrensis]RYU65445.1 DUF4156 domain-containing protein [Aliivibrio finisterrensis]
MKTLIASSMLASSMILTGCVTFPTQESEKVDVIWDEVEVVKDCQRLGIVFGSEGHFYDYWLHADKDMVWGTLNQMRIKAAALGADTLYLYQSLDFSSSVTMFGNAYLCKQSAESTVQVK